MADGPEQILALNAFDARRANDLSGELGRRVARRTAAFGAASVLFYDQPLDFVRGAGCLLYDDAGVEYLDAYNNVPSVGHCHPHVVAAVTRQLAALNVHNRYLHDGVLNYAERLLRTFPKDLSNVTFTCTGSESNDLALRLAAKATGRRGVIVTAAAYHGNTAWVTDASPTLIQHAPTAPHVRYIAAPDSLRVPKDRLGEVFAGHVREAIADLESCGIGFSALLIDGIFSSDGVYPDPPGFLRAAVDVVHDALGLYIADEVQCGFGRTGASLWGFERHGVAPDVVTLGKPMGNGYPMGAVITRPETLAGFCAEFGYFNTFAGSPVAAAAGGAVLDVIESEELIENARTVGAYLKAALVALAARHTCIIDVRGAGFYVGVELAGAGREAATVVKRVLNGMRERRVLIGAAGRFGNVLKIRPPLCFSRGDADRLVTELDAVLTEVATP
jgi:4-aminobutyrate aminotransferase-like enzyme